MGAIAKRRYVRRGCGGSGGRRRVVAVMRPVIFMILAPKAVIIVLFLVRLVRYFSLSLGLRRTFTIFREHCRRILLFSILVVWSNVQPRHPLSNSRLATLIATPANLGQES